MPQQRGMKRAEKVLKRARRIKKQEKEANLRRLERLLTNPPQREEVKEEEEE